MAVGIVMLGFVICSTAIFVGEYDDAPGASLFGVVLLIGAVVLAVRIARRKS
jgi:hypothetical protein